MAQLQAALMGILRRRKAGAAKKRAALLEALEQDTAERLSSLQVQAAEERRGLEAQAQRALHELTGRMEAKVRVCHAPPAQALPRDSPRGAPLHSPIPRPSRSTKSWSPRMSSTWQPAGGCGKSTSTCTTRPAR